MMYSINKHFAENRVSLELNGVHVTSVRKENVDVVLIKLKTITKPSFCTMCDEVHEFDGKEAFLEDRGHYSKHYCGCKGWD